MNLEQLELRLGANICQRHRRSNRRTAARWWFSRMRAAVHAARDCGAHARGPGEQAHLPLVTSRAAFNGQRVDFLPAFRNRC